jgi:hypothetical protein
VRKRWRGCGPISTGSLDNLLARRAVVDTGGAPAYAHLSMRRTAHECAHSAHWLIDTILDAPERIARGVAARAVDLDERLKCEAAVRLTTPVPPMVSAGQRLADLMVPPRRGGWPGSTRRSSRSSP